MFEDELILGIYPQSDYLSESLIIKFNDKGILTKQYASIADIDSSKLNYLIINLANQNISVNKSETEKLFTLISKSTCKVILIYPQYVNSDLILVSEKFLNDIILASPNLSVILSPVLLGKSVKYINNNCVHDLILQVALSGRIKILNDSRLINMSSLNKFCDKVVKEALSFGSLGKRLLVVGERRIIRTVATKYLKININNLIVANGQYDYSEVKSDQTIKADFSLRAAIKNTKFDLISSTEDKIEKPTVVVNENSKPSKKILPKFKWKILANLLVSFLFIALIPFFLIIIATSFLYISYKTYNFKNNTSQNLIKASIELTQFANKISFGNNLYFNASSAVQKTSDLALESISLVQLGNEFQSKIMGNENYDVRYYTDNISASLDKIHTNLSFLEIEISSFGEYLSRKMDIFSIKQKVYDFRVLASRLSILLGSDKPMKYLVLFQNNMELRPTGGFIGSYAMITFDKGKLSEINVSDMYSADGQLKGHVDPPEPLRKHLGEGGWYMRDANWDPDFKESSIKVEWFLEKEVNEKVDGVIAIDLSFVRDILKITGPLDLVDFNKQITFDNLYSETQTEVENSFFPGSIKKTSFLTSLSKNLILAVETMPSEKWLGFVKEVYTNLESRHIQIYLHDSNSQKALSNLGFTGELDMDIYCNTRCISDRYLLVDANLGVNKANLFINRSQVLNTTISKTGINHELTVRYENKAGVAVGKSGVYKTYTRLILPKEADIVGVRIYETDGKYLDAEFDKNYSSDKKEIGFLVEVVPNSQKLVQLVWNLNTANLENGGEYNLTVFKQAGTDEDLLKVVARVKDLTLTGKPVTVYNTNLIRDFETKLFVK